MIINFSKIHARRSAPAVRVDSDAQKIRLVCRWVANPAGGKLHAVWVYPAAEVAADDRQAIPDRLCVAA